MKFGMNKGQITKQCIAIKISSIDDLPSIIEHGWVCLASIEILLGYCLVSNDVVNGKDPLGQSKDIK